MVMWSMFKIFNGVLMEYKREKGETNIKIPDGVRGIGNGAFCCCRTIKSVELPDSVTKIEPQAFKNCTNLEHIILSEQLTSIDDEAFYACVNLGEIEFPSMLSYIGSRVFYGCKYLERIRFPECLTEIGDESFKVCINLEEIEFGNSIQKIGRQAFANTSWLERKRKENPLVIVNNILIDAYKCKNILSIPDNVATISEGAFEKNTKISELLLKSDQYEKSITINNSSEIENIFRLINSSKNIQEVLLQQIEDEELKIHIAMFLAFGKGNFVGEKYLSDNIIKTVKSFIQSNDIENMKNILKGNYITDSNIDELVGYSIEHERFEIQTLLLEHKNETIGFQNVHDRFKL